jgi:hypothetical protein
MDPWYKNVQLRKEVREGRSFNPDEFAIALEQVVAGTAPEDYRDPSHFMDRTVLTRALREHSGMVLRRLSGRTDNAAPVLTLITQFGGGKTHTLTTLFHLAKHGDKISGRDDVRELLRDAGLNSLPEPKVAVFVGNAWDPQPGRETPWIDLARQLAGDAGVAALGSAAQTTPPGTESLAKLFDAAGGCVLVLFDEVLNFVNRHRSMADGFHAFIQNLTVAMTGTTRGVAVISLPRSQVEMTDYDMAWQEKIVKITKRVAKDLIVNDEAEISEVIRRRLFDYLGDEKTRKRVAKEYAEWCFERRAQLPPEWTSVDTATSDTKAKEYLASRFEACYPFHPATISVFQRKWQALRQYQQTRGTLAMLAQWVSLVSQEQFRQARKEPLISLGSAPLHEPHFRAAILGQLGEPRLVGAIDADIAGGQSHAKALDVQSGASGLLDRIHQRLATAILFESSGGMAQKTAHLPELRFAIGGPGLDTTSIDTATSALYDRCFFLRKVSLDGYWFGYAPTLKKVVNDRRASLDDTEVATAAKDAVRKEFERGANVPLIFFPEDSSAVPDSPKLTCIVLDPSDAWENGNTREMISGWTKERGASGRLYPAALIWCVKKPGRELREKVEQALAWKRVQHEERGGILGADFSDEDRRSIPPSVGTAESDVRDEVWASYRYLAYADSSSADGLSVIDLGAGHASSGETLCGRIIAAMKSQALLNEQVGAGYLERSWPPAFKDSGAWPLSSLRQSFLNGSLTRLLDPDEVLRRKIVEFVRGGDFGLASGRIADGSYSRIWFNEHMGSENVEFVSDVFLLAKATAKATTRETVEAESGTDAGSDEDILVLEPDKDTATTKPSESGSTTTTSMPTGTKHAIVVQGTVPPEVWNRLGTKLIPKLRTACPDLTVKVEFTGSSERDAAALRADVGQVLADLGLSGAVKADTEEIAGQE